MIKKTIVFTDYNNQEQIVDAYFNLNQPELIELSMQYPDGLDKYIENLDPENRPQEVMDLFKDIIERSYGTKSEDGLYFVKDDDKYKKFTQSAAYEALFMELMQNTDEATAFILGLMSEATRQQIAEAQNHQGN